MSRRSHRWRGPQPGSRNPAGRPGSQSGVQRPRPDGPVSPAVTQQEPAPEDRQPRVPAPAAETVPVHSVPGSSTARPEPVPSAAPPEPVALAAAAVTAVGPAAAVTALERPAPRSAASGLEPPTSRGPLDAGRPAFDALTASVPGAGRPLADAPAGPAASGVAAGASTQRPPSPPVLGADGLLGPDGRGGCTAAQLRRFIKSRAYVPLHELRRRFELNGDEDDVSPIDLGGRRLFVGLPDREARLLGELFEAGDVGYELLLDPTSPLVVGVFPMRPVPRA